MNNVGERGKAKMIFIYNYKQKLGNWIKIGNALLPPVLISSSGLGFSQGQANSVRARLRRKDAREQEEDRQKDCMPILFCLMHLHT